jgi:hypothetical protein
VKSYVLEQLVISVEINLFYNSGRGTPMKGKE